MSLVPRLNVALAQTDYWYHTMPGAKKRAPLSNSRSLPPGIRKLSVPWHRECHRVRASADQDANSSSPAAFADLKPGSTSVCSEASVRSGGVATAGIGAPVVRQDG